MVHVLVGDTVQWFLEELDRLNQPAVRNMKMNTLK